MLGRVIEKVSGGRLAEFLDEHLFKGGRVVGMTSKIAGEPPTPRESWDPNRQICFAACGFR